KVVMLDDVITAGTTVRETIHLLKNFSATFSGIVIAFDREERGESSLSATQEVVQEYNIPVASILKLSDVIHYLSARKEFDEQLVAIKAYQEQYGI
ncbi:MAG TPA: phosphoribosyltransferase family protein, partial [Coxiellaceae bacterium]|nr:phosphoribosyltransferase family protein [Coxiellaceae bacterium]